MSRCPWSTTRRLISALSYAQLCTVRLIQATFHHESVEQLALAGVASAKVDVSGARYLFIKSVNQAGIDQIK